MAGVEVIGAIASFSQVIAYSTQIIEHIQNAAQRAKSGSIHYLDQLKNVRHVIFIIEFISSVDGLHTHEIMEQVEDIKTSARHLHEALEQVILEGQKRGSQFWKRFLKELGPQDSLRKAISRGFSELQDNKASLTLCILTTYSHVVVDVGRLMKESAPLLQQTFDKVCRVEDTLRDNPESLQELQYARRVRLNATRALHLRGAYYSVADIIPKEDALDGDPEDGCLEGSFSNASTFCGELPVSNTVELPYDTCLPRVDSALTEEHVGNYQVLGPHATQQQSDLSSVVNTESEHNGTIDLPSDSGIEHEAPSRSAWYGNCVSGESIQVNGDMGTATSPDYRYRIWSGNISQGNSRQISGNVTDANIALALFSRR